jgi:putative hydrolase of the HAD superfamily
MVPLSRNVVRAVIFDYGGVITEPIHGLFERLAEGSGASLAEVAMLLIGSYAENLDHPWHRLERGEIPFDEVCRWASEEGARRGWQLDLGSMPALMNELTIRPQALDYVRSLRARGYSTGMITNNVFEFGDTWKGMLPLDELFDVVVNSCDVGLRKPDPRIYRLALERLGGLEPGEAAFLDDFPENVRGAEQVGLRAIHVTDWQAAIDRLEKMLS